VAELVTGAGECLAVAREAVAAAMTAGADAAEVFIRSGPAERLTWRGPDLVTESVGLQCEVLVRVWRYGRSLAVTGNTVSGRLRDMATSAVAAAASHGEELAAHLRPGPADVWLPADADRGQDRTSLAEALAEVAALPGLRPAQLTAVSSRVRQWTIVVNSLYLAVGYERVQELTWLWADWPRGRIGEAAVGGGADGVLAAGRRLAGQTSLMRATPGRPPAGSPGVLLAPPAAAHLARSLGAMLTGDNLGRGLRPLLERLGGRMASEVVDLTDAPLLPGGLRTRPLDDEGTPTRDVPLLRAGRLTGLLHTMRSARELGDEPTGSAVRPALWRPPAAGHANVRIEPGVEGPDELRAALRTGIEVVGLARPGRIQDGTGKFLLAAHGWAVDGGERTSPLLGVPLSASIFELLRGVRARGCDLTYVPLADGAGAPSLLLDRMRVG
jgi:predicted Zn-dependent protease